MTTTGRTGARNYRDRKDLSSSESESSFEQILSRSKNMSDKGLSPAHKRRNRSRSGDRDHYRSRKRSYSPRDRSSSPLRKPMHRSNDRYQSQHFEGNRRPYMRFPRRPYFDRGQGRGMRRNFRGFANRNFQFNPRYHDQHNQQGAHYYKDRGYQPQGDRNRRRSISRSHSRSRSRSRSRTPPRRRSVSPGPKRRLSRSLSPMVSTSVSSSLPKPSYKNKDVKPVDSEKMVDKRYSKRSKDGDVAEKDLQVSKSAISKNPKSQSSSSGRPVANESKLSFSREDLEKITIDIHRNVKEPSPTLRRIVNPDEVKLVRRVNEGARPLFEREEIQNPTEDLREEITERRIISVKDSINLENKGITLTKDSGIDVRDYAQTEGSSRIPLSKRWQQDEGSAPAVSSYSSVPKVHSSITRRSYSEERDQSPVYERNRGVSPAGENFSRISSVRGRDSYRESSVERPYERHYPDDPSDLSTKPLLALFGGVPDDGLDDGKAKSSQPFSKHSLSLRRKEDNFDDSHRKFVDRSEWRHGSESSQRRFKGELERSYRSRSRSRSRSPLTSFDLQLRGRSEERLPDFSQRPDRFKYNAWTDKPEVIPKGPSYYEHDDRDRGGNRAFRARGFRTNRFFRPRNFRTGFQSRGSFVPRTVGSQSVRRPTRPFRSSSGYVPRTRGYIPRGKDSPSHWEHDMFNKLDKNDEG